VAWAVLRRSAICPQRHNTVQFELTVSVAIPMRTRLPAIVPALLCGTAFLPAAYPQSGNVDKPQVLDEVTVEAHRQKLSQLRQQIKKIRR
jgi:hypothetical protein